MTLFSSWFWPDVSTRKNATFATTEAFYVLLGVATLVALFTFVDFARGWEFGHPGALLLAIAVALALLHGVRGACAFHKFAPIPANTPSIEQSFRSFGQNSPRSEKDTGRN